MKQLGTIHRVLLAGLSLALLAACAAPATPTGAPATAASSSAPAPAAAGSGQITLAGYSTPAEAYARIIPLFQADYKAKTGQDVNFATSYGGSGAQSRAVIAGLEADVVALALAPDVDNIAKARLITHDWTTSANKGIVSHSVVAFAVRQGNPKAIKDWADLAQAGLSVLTPDAATSGGARWNILGLYGAALRGQVTGVTKDDQPGAQAFLASVLKNVTVFDKDARTSVTSFEKGIGDVAITYENEVLLGRQRGDDFELVIPHATILIETPVAVVDANVDKHGHRAAAEAFVNFLFTAPAQQVFAQYGFRPIEPSVAAATASQFPPVADPFTVAQFGGWSQAGKDVFASDTGIYYQALAAAQGK